LFDFASHVLYKNNKQELGCKIEQTYHFLYKKFIEKIFSAVSLFLSPLSTKPKNTTFFHDFTL